jgi:hypothetical protein
VRVNAGGRGELVIVFEQQYGACQAGGTMQGVCEVGC